MSSRVGNTVPRGMPCLEWNTVSSGIPDACRAARDIALQGIFRIAQCALPLHMRHRAGRGTWAGYRVGRHNGARDTVPRGIPCRAGYRVVRGTEPGAPCGAGFQDKPVEAEPLASDDGKLMMLDEGIPPAPHGVGVPRS